MNTENIILIDTKTEEIKNPPISGKHILDLTREELQAYLAENLGLKSYRSDQIFKWIYDQKVSSFDEMTNINKETRLALSSHFEFAPLPIVSWEQSIDGSRKYLFKVGENQNVEAVMIKQPTRMTLCVSSQVGCGMGCKFCMTATMGFQKNLTVSQILGQVLGVAKHSLEYKNEVFHNIVFMGMGEPFHNFKNVTKALTNLTDQKGFSFAPRKITVSTVGLVPRILKFGELGLANLAVSLNATTHEIREQIMPITKRYSFDELIDSLRKTYPICKSGVNRRKAVTIEYVMLAGVNDTKEDMNRLVSILEGINAKVNLIPYNENSGLPYKSPSRTWVFDWYNKLSKVVPVTVRWSKGRDINAACGQLATSHQKKIAS